MNYLEEARILRTIIETAVHSIPDGEALEAAVLHPVWKVGIAYSAGFYMTPSPRRRSMALENGKHYSQDGVTYLCNRDTVNPVYNPLRELVGIYVEIVN